MFAAAFHAMGFPKPNLLNTTEWVSLFVGFILVALIGPPVGAVVGSCVLWEACDRGFAGGFVESGQELSGFIFARLIPLIERITTPYALPIIIKMHLPRSPHSHKKKPSPVHNAGSTSGWSSTRTTPSL